MKKKQVELLKIRELIARHPEGLNRGEVATLLGIPLKDKTLQRRLRDLVEAGDITRSGERRATRYYPSWGEYEKNSETQEGANKDKNHGVFSENSLKILEFLNKPVYSRPKKSYNRPFLERYVPNDTVYVPVELRREMAQKGQRVSTGLAAGTYARQIYQRLLIDLSFNSSRLEGNTYSELDTKRLVEEGISAEGKVREETVMIMNHKQAISFLVENAQEIELSAFTVYNLHALLSEDLLKNPMACGKVRCVSVEIGKSAYKPMDNPHQLKEYLEMLLLKARSIEDPFEQSFFLLTHLSYLQAFEDVNKRTARLACNIPFFKSNLCPLSFVKLPRDDYLNALLMIYETNTLEPMLELYHWAYLRSCEQYDVVKESLGEIDAFRVEYRQQRKDVMGQVIREGVHGREAERLIKNYCKEHNIKNTDKFIAMVLADLSSLHEGAIVGLGVTQNQFEKWKSKRV